MVEFENNHKVGRTLYAKRTALDLCLDCPVKLAEEAMDESACEAATEL